MGKKLTNDETDYKYDDCGGNEVLEFQRKQERTGKNL